MVRRVRSRASSAAADGEEQALGEELAGEPGARDAEGEAHRHLAAAALGARQEHVGEVGAHHQEHQADGAEQHRGGGPEHLVDVRVVAHVAESA